MIYAGRDSDGTNYNHNAWHVPGGGAGLWRAADGSYRSVQLRNGSVLPIQNPMSYHRPMSAAHYTVPFEVGGEIFLHSRATNPWISGENRAPTWEWAPNVHPVFVDEDNNVVTGLSPSKGRWSASGQINKVYGIPRQSLFVASMDHDAQLGAWHRWRVVVPATGVHEVYWDDLLVYRVVEKSPPAAWWGRPMRVALRLDFYDYSLRNLTGDDVTLYPDGYGTSKITFDQMVAKHSKNMHPEFKRRFFAYIKHKNGLLGVGGGYRPPGTQPGGTPGFAPPGKSFHEGQTWASGLTAYAAIDLVKPNPFNSADKHVAPAWSDTEDAPLWGLHTFVSGEPWHIQPIEVRGWQTWYNNGRRDPGKFALPGENLSPPTIPQPAEEVDMIALDHKPGTPDWTALSWTGVELSHVANGHADAVIRRAGVARQTVSDNEVDAIIASSTTKTACPSAWVNTPRGAAWAAQRG